MWLPKDFYERLPRYYLGSGVLCLAVGMGEPTTVVSAALLLASAAWVTGLRRKARAERARVARRREMARAGELRSLDDLSSLY